MATPVTVNYTPVGDDWQVAVVRGEETLTGRAPGLIAARDTADQLVERLTKGEGPPVVHLLEGDAVAFSTAYLHARHGGYAGAPAEEALARTASAPEAAQTDSDSEDTGDSEAIDDSADIPSDQPADQQPDGAAEDSTDEGGTDDEATVWPQARHTEAADAPPAASEAVS